MKRAVYVLVTIGLVAGLFVGCKETASSPIPPTTPPRTSPAASPTPTRPTPTAPAAETPQYGGTIRVASQNPPRSLVPEIQTIKNWFMLAPYDTLLRVDEQGEVRPWLATEWKFGADNKSLTLSLRKGVKFHDGTDFNAAAVKWNIELRKAAKLGDYQDVTSVDAVDDYTVRLNLAKFQNTLLVSMWFIGGMMQSPTAYDKFGKADAQWNPVGTGPFKFVSYDQNTTIKYVRFDGYWQTGKPYLDGFEQVVIADPTTRLLALQKGEIHAAEALEAKSVSELQQQGWPMLSGPVETYSIFVADTANADSPLANQKVREAVEYAIDRPGIVDALGFGRQEAIYQMTPSDTYAYISTLKGRLYDKTKAKQLLTEAGYPNGFKTTILTRDTIAQVLLATQTNLKDVGIDANIDLADAGRFVQTTQQGWKNMLIYRAFRVPPDWLQFAYSYLSGTTLESRSWLRPTGFQDMLETGLASPDLAGKKAASQKIVQKLYDEALVIPLWSGKPGVPTIPHNKNVRNLGYYIPWGSNKLWGPADVWLSK